MAEMQTLARPYARAVFSVAREQQQLPAWAEALQRLATAASDAKMAAIIGHPSVAADVLVSMLLELSAATKLAGVENLLKVLAEHRRLKLLPQLALEFDALRAAYEQLCQVDVRSAAELGESQRDSFVTALKRRLGLDVNVQWAVEPELIGGAVVAAGDLVIDGSVRGELNRLRTGLTQ